MIVLILAGGSGTRLWPLSTTARPKHLLKLFGGYSLFQRTVSRLACSGSSGGPGISGIFTITNFLQSDLISDHLSEIGVSSGILVEPKPMNTAPAIGLALFGGCSIPMDDDQIMGVFPADHLITDEEAFASALSAAVEAAREGFVCTLGISPHRPEPGFGYIEYDPARPVAGCSPARHAGGVDIVRADGSGAIGHRGFASGALEVIRFVEKPDEVTARQYLKAGIFLWNAGIFVFKVSVMRNLYRRFLPTTVEILTSMDQAMPPAMLAKKFGKCENASIDRGVMEKADRVAVVPCDMGWSDMGSFDAIYEAADKDSAGNVAIGRVHAEECAGSLMVAHGRPLGVHGIRNMILVGSDDGFLAVPMGSSREVRAVADAVEKVLDPFDARDAAKPWGSYHVLHSAFRTKVKRLVVLPGAEISLQSHERRDEVWTVARGEATVTLGEEVTSLTYGSTVRIPRRIRHRLANRGHEILEVIEVQTGDYFGEDDIVRYLDRYGRA